MTEPDPEMDALNKEWARQQDAERAARTGCLVGIGVCLVSAACVITLVYHLLK